MYYILTECPEAISPNNHAAVMSVAAVAVDSVVVLVDLTGDFLDDMLNAMRSGENTVVGTDNVVAVVVGVVVDVAVAALADIGNGNVVVYYDIVVVDVVTDVVAVRDIHPYHYCYCCYLSRHCLRVV